LFTQPDPIGLAGGLNAFGYAGGDPINKSDPFGLCPPQDSNLSDCPGFWSTVGAATGALFGGVGGGGAGMLAGPGAPIAVPAFSAAGALKGAAIGTAIGATLDGIVMASKGEAREIGSAITEVMGRAANTETNRRCVGRYLENCKAAGDRGTKNDRGDFNYRELLQKVREYFNNPEP
jgi:hypothetical protein